MALPPMMVIWEDRRTGEMKRASQKACNNDLDTRSTCRYRPTGTLTSVEAPSSGQAIGVWNEETHCTHP